MDAPTGRYLADTIAPLLPELPDEDDIGLPYEGRAWLEQLDPAAWTPIDHWGSDTEPLPTWPYEAIAHHDGAGIYGLAVHTPGLTTVHGYRSRTARDADTTGIYRHWAHTTPTD